MGYTERNEGLKRSFLVSFLKASIFEEMNLKFEYAQRISKDIIERL